LSKAGSVDCFLEDYNISRTSYDRLTNLLVANRPFMEQDVRDIVFNGLTDTELKSALALDERIDKVNLKLPGFRTSSPAPPSVIRKHLKAKSLLRHPFILYLSKYRESIISGDASQEIITGLITHLGESRVNPAMTLCNCISEMEYKKCKSEFPGPFTDILMASLGLGVEIAPETVENTVAWSAYSAFLLRFIEKHNSLQKDLSLLINSTLDVTETLPDIASLSLLDYNNKLKGCSSRLEDSLVKFTRLDEEQRSLVKEFNGFLEESDVLSRDFKSIAQDVLDEIDKSTDVNFSDMIIANLSDENDKLLSIIKRIKKLHNQYMATIESIEENNRSLTSNDEACELLFSELGIEIDYTRGVNHVISLENIYDLSSLNSQLLTQKQNVESNSSVISTKIKESLSSFAASTMNPKREDLVLLYDMETLFKNNPDPTTLIKDFVILRNKFNATQKEKGNTKPSLKVDFELTTSHSFDLFSLAKLILHDIPNKDTDQHVWDIVYNQDPLDEKLMLQVHEIGQLRLPQMHLITSREHELSIPAMHALILYVLADRILSGENYSANKYMSLCNILGHVKEDDLFILLKTVITINTLDNFIDIPMPSFSSARYFGDSYNSYQKKIIKQGAYGGFGRQVVEKIFIPLHEKYYLSLCAGGPQTQLQKLHNSLKKITPENLWNLSEINGKGEYGILLKNTDTYVREKYISEFNDILNDLIMDLDMLIGFNSTTLNATLNKIFNSTEIEAELILISRILASFSDFNGNILQSSFEQLEVDILHDRQFYLHEPALIRQLFHSQSNEYSDLLLVNDDQLNELEIFQSQSDHIAILEWYLSNDMLNSYLLSWLKEAGMEDQYRSNKVKIQEKEKRYDAHTSTLYLFPAYEEALRHHRFGICENILHDAERRDVEEQTEKDNTLKSLSTKIDEMIFTVRTWVKSNRKNAYKEILHERAHQIEKRQFDEQTASLEQDYKWLCKVIEATSQPANPNLSFLDEELSGENVSSKLITDQSQSINIDQLYNILKTGRAPVELKERIDSLQGNDVQSLLEQHRKVRNGTITGASLYDVTNSSIEKYLRSFSKVFRRLSIDSELTKYYQSIMHEPILFKSGRVQSEKDQIDIPFFHTQRYMIHRKDEKEELYVLLSGLKKYQLDNLYTMSRIIKTRLGSKYFPDRYHFIVIVLGGDATKIKSKTSTTEFDHVSIIDPQRLVSFLLHAHKTPEKALTHFLNRRLSIDSLNPFQTENVVDELNGVFVGRTRLINKIVENTYNYGIYGARRVGKTSMARVVDNRLQSKGYMTTFKSIATGDLTANDKNIHGFPLACSILKDLGGDYTSISAFEDLQPAYEDLINRDKNQRYCIILDEFDNFIMKSDEYYSNQNRENPYDLIHLFRNLKNQFPENLKIIISGFTHLYEKMNQLNEGDNISNPWKGFVSSTQVNVFHKEEALMLVEKLEDSLDLTFETNDLKYYILRKTSHHPAYIQRFLSNLINIIAPRINQDYRIIRKVDIDRVFDEYIITEIRDWVPFIKYVDDTTRMNVGTIPLSIVALMVIFGDKRYVRKSLMAEIQKETGMPADIFDTSLNTLNITQILSLTSTTVSFKNDFWYDYLQLIADQNDEHFLEIIENAQAEIRKIV